MDGEPLTWTGIRSQAFKLIICKSSGDLHHLLARRPVNILRNLSFSKGDYSKVRRQPSKKHWTKRHFTFLYTHYINQYTAKDTVGKEYGDLAANIGPISEKPFTNTISNQSFTLFRFMNKSLSCFWIVSLD